MKPIIKITAIAIFSLFLAVQPSAAKDSTTTDTFVGVRQLMNSVDQYADNIIVQGIVSKVFSQDNLIGLIDNRTTKGCSKTNAKECTQPCGDAVYPLTLPVQWKGDMPEPADEVRVAGKITRQDGRLLFVAESLKVISD